MRTSLSEKDEFYHKCEKDGIYKMHKNVIMCRKEEKRSFQLIHTQNTKNRGKI